MFRYCLAVRWLKKHTEQDMILVAPIALESAPECVLAWRDLGGEHETWTELGGTQNLCPKTNPLVTGNFADLDLITALLDEFENNQNYSISGKYLLGLSKAILKQHG